MIVAYCASCLPNKIVLGYSDRISEVKAPHAGHPQTKKNGYFPISYKGWKQVFVEGDDVQTKANIVAQFGGEFV
jgi:hypothetical protein